MPEVDGSQYMTAQVEVYGRTADEIISRSDEFLSRFGNEVEPDIQENLDRQRASDLKNAEAATWLHEVSAPVRRLIDQARARVFLALSEGNIHAHGFVLKTDEVQDVQFCEIIAIPSEAWSLDTIDWLSASTTVDSTEVKGAHVTTSEMLALFPPSELRGEPISGKVTGGLFIPDQDGMTSIATQATSRRRGRPTKGNGLIEKAIRNEFGRLAEAGEISNKKEANIQMMIEWAERILGETVSRTSVQRWLEQSPPSAQK